MFCHIHGLPDLNDDPDARRWLALAYDLALGLDEDMGPGPEDPSIYMAAHMVASAIWRQTGGDPCWSKLDVERFVAECEGLPIWPHYGDAILVGTQALYTFLAKFGHTPPAQAANIHARLAPWVVPIMEACFRDFFAQEPTMLH